MTRSTLTCATLTIAVSVLLSGCSGRAGPGRGSGPGAPAAESPSGQLRAALRLAARDFQAGDPIEAEFYVWNGTPNSSLRLNGLFRPYPFGHDKLPVRVSVLKGRRECGYTGLLINVATLQPEDYVVLRPGALYGVRFDLYKLYQHDLRGPGTYRVRMYYVNAARSLDGGPPLWTGRTGVAEATFRVKKP